jgi:hypothetical protein
MRPSSPGSSESESPEFSGSSNISYFLLGDKGVVGGRWVERLRREDMRPLVSSWDFFRSGGFGLGEGWGWVLGWGWGWGEWLGLGLRGGDGVGLADLGFELGFWAGLGRGSKFSTRDASRLSWR